MKILILISTSQYNKVLARVKNLSKQAYYKERFSQSMGGIQ